MKALSARFYMPETPSTKNPLLRILGVCLVITMLVACTSDNHARYSKQGVGFDLPKDWEVFEDITLNDQHRSINLVTSRGSMVGLDLLSFGEQDQRPDMNAYVKRYVSSALPTEELRASASIDFGVQTRIGHEGTFVHIATTTPIKSEFLIEIYQLANTAGSTFVVFNTPDSELDILQQDFNQFLASISNSSK